MEYVCVVLGVLEIARENRRGGHAFPSTPPSSSHAAWLPVCLSFYFVAKGHLKGQTTAAAQGRSAKSSKRGWEAKSLSAALLAVWLPSFPRRPTALRRRPLFRCLCTSRNRHCQAFECGLGWSFRVCVAVPALGLRGEVGQCPLAHDCYLEPSCHLSVSSTTQASCAFAPPPRPLARLTESHRVVFPVE